MTDLPEVGGYILHPFRRWFQRCERCGKRRVIAYYFEVYSQQGPESCWWYECQPCFLVTLDRLGNGTKRYRN